MKKGIFYILSAALIYGIVPVFCNYTYIAGNNSFTLTFYRNLFVIPVLYVLCKEKKIGYALPLQRLPDLLIAGLFSVFTTLFLYKSYNYLSAGTASAIYFLYPLFVTVISRYAFHDVIARGQKKALFLASAGVVLSALSQNLPVLKGILFAAASSLCYALYLVWIEKRKLSLLNDYKLSYYLALVACPVLLVVNLFTHELIWTLPVKVYGLIGLISMLTSFLATVLLKKGIESVGTGMASILSLSEPVFVLFFSVLFLQESVTWNKMIGCLLILSGIWSMFQKRGVYEENRTGGLRRRWTDVKHRILMAKSA